MKGYCFYPLLVFLLVLEIGSTVAQDIPLPEHPRPDFHRSAWINLNGSWDFAFDPEQKGLEANWASESSPFTETIRVPFPWGSKLSGQEDLADIGWYRKSITVDPSWDGERIFLIIGAADWETHVWLDGNLIGSHRGGYVPIEMDLTEYVKFGNAQDLVIRVDDMRRDFTLYGKQGYGNARGIWQTVYLEARPETYIDYIQIAPDIDQEKAQVTVFLPHNAQNEEDLTFTIENAPKPITQTVSIPKGAYFTKFDVSIDDPILWELDNPHLYEVTATLGKDEVHTYFGMRKVSVVDLPGTDYPYIALNDKPIYLQLALDQSYHPQGFYTFPSDQFMREEIERSKAIGLNGIRIHIKVEVPRKLYWADKLGLLVMADLPNSWGEPDAKLKHEATFTLHEMIKRDFNHPAIFSWIDFNETWGLRTEVEENGKKIRRYLPETQDWVASMYYLTKSLDPTRLVEDNSICCGAGHTETDINSWHAYLPGWEWENHLKNMSENTYPGSSHDFEAGFSQGRQPNINSECGNVWGYEGSTGDIDWSWDYHRMINTFRKYPKIAGWLYTEHHDVINEWNGYWRFDRSEKETGVGAIFDGMSLRDLHAPVFLSTGNDICLTVKGGTEVEVPLYLSVMDDQELGSGLTLKYALEHTNYIGETEKIRSGSRKIAYKAWAQEELKPLIVSMPTQSGVTLLKLWLEDENGAVHHRNFMHFVVEGLEKDSNVIQISKAPTQFSDASWSVKQWDVMDGKKLNGAGKGYIEYTFPLSEEISTARLAEVYVVAELSAKQLFVKDEAEFDRNQDYMKGSRVAPSSNPNSYPMSDEVLFPSRIVAKVNGMSLMRTTLEDDPADHRGVLSWHHQLKDKKLREAGSYGYLVKVPIPTKMLREGKKVGSITLRFETQGEGGLAVYGKDFGRYPVDPSLVLRYK